jgi:hypothetical protein
LNAKEQAEGAIKKVPKEDQVQTLIDVVVNLVDRIGKLEARIPECTCPDNYTTGCKWECPVHGRREF